MLLLCFDLFSFVVCRLIEHGVWRTGHVFFFSSSSFSNVIHSRLGALQTWVNPRKDNLTEMIFFPRSSVQGPTFLGQSFTVMIRLRTRLWAC